MTQKPPTLETLTLGTSSEALIGRDINTYFFNGHWLTPLKKYLDSDKILPTSVRLSELPAEALIVKACSGYLTHGIDIPELPIKAPSYFNLYFTGYNEQRQHIWTSLFKAYLCFTIKNKTFSNSYKRIQYLTCCSSVVEDIFKDSDPDHAACPYISFGGHTPYLFLQDMTYIQIAVEYVLKLLHIGLGYQYNDATYRWLEKGIT